MLKLLRDAADERRVVLNCLLKYPKSSRYRCPGNDIVSAKIVEFWQFCNNFHSKTRLRTIPVTRGNVDLSNLQAYAYVLC